jgi:hypothetical protein
MEEPTLQSKPPHCVLLRRVRRKMRNAAIASWIFAILHLMPIWIIYFSSRCDWQYYADSFCRGTVWLCINLIVFLLITGLGVLVGNELSARLLPLYSATVVLLVCILLSGSFMYFLVDWSSWKNLTDILPVIIFGAIYGSHLYFAYHGLEGTFAYQDLIRENEHNQ